jgi:hypothetical protein
MSNYRKLIAAIISMALLIVNQKWGYDLTGFETEIVNLVILAIGSFAVWRFPNTPSQDTVLRAPALSVILAAGLALLLMGCAGTSETKATNAVAIACDSYATLLEGLTPYKAEMSEAQIARVDATNLLVDPVCLPGSVIDPATGVQTVREGIGLLRNLREVL